MTKTRLNWTADFLSHRTQNNHCCCSCMVLCLLAPRLFLSFSIRFCISCVCVVLLFCKHLHIESVPVPQPFCEHVFECVCCMYTNMQAFSSLPQVGDNRMAEVGTVLWTMTASRLGAGLCPRLWTLHLVRWEKCQTGKHHTAQGGGETGS